jgi:hypothetical protein
VGGVEESERVDMCESRVWERDLAKSERGCWGERGGLGRESVESVGVPSYDVCRLSVSTPR